VPALFLLLTRCNGLLVVVPAVFALVVLDVAPTMDTSAWAFHLGVIDVVILPSLAAYGFWTAKAGRPLLGAGYFGDVRRAG
jgi:hypothetical protein